MGPRAQLRAQLHTQQLGHTHLSVSTKGLPLLRDQEIALEGVPQSLMLQAESLSLRFHMLEP